MSFIARLWNAVRKPIQYVGRDLEGNRFYEGHSPNDPSRPKRTVQYHNEEDVWKYIGGGKRLPIQWSAWLTHTRAQPPTLEELQADMARQQRVMANVAIIEARDQAEAEERLRIRRDDAQKALEIAAGRSEQSRRVQNVREDTLRTSNASSSAETSPRSATEQDARMLSADGTTTIRPPSFLTPATPRKSKRSQASSSTSSPSQFNVPPFGTTASMAQGAFEQERQRLEAEVDAGSSSEGRRQDAVQEEKKETARGLDVSEVSKKGSSLPTMPSRSVETESWTPKARRRG
ncbi:hypothetical protein B0H34DRAFT_714199 [Crassisporium funariophilum]|nr:hypothetical protein B0H34DRAFT_714199 [Crassisporium funariophilum]